MNEPTLRIEYKEIPPQETHGEGANNDHSLEKNKWDHQKKTRNSLVLIHLNGAFEVDYWEEMRELISALDLKASQDVILDFSKLVRFDTFGAWQISRFINHLKLNGVTYRFHHIRKADKALILDICDLKVPEETLKKTTPHGILPLISRVGERTLSHQANLIKTISFLGWIFLGFWTLLKRKRRFRWRSFYSFIDDVGFQALPIISMIAFLIGVVLVYQGISQLERFGAQIFTVNLLAISVLRELGILLTAIVVAGRSGSSFTAQIGFMKLNQEIDAMQVMGLSPLQILIIPRILALIVCMPLLTVFCDLIALGGGAIMCASLIHLSVDQFLVQLQSSIQPWTFWTGLIKAPVFAFVIGFVACQEGMRVKGGAEDVGRRTTQSVVKSIFLVLVLDAIFSVLYSYLGI